MQAAPHPIIHGNDGNKQSILLTRLTVSGHARELGASGADLRSVDGNRVVQVGAVDVVRVRVVDIVRKRVSGHLSAGQSLRHVVDGG